MTVPASELLSLALAVAAAGVATGLLAGLFGIGGGAVTVPVLFEIFRVSTYRHGARSFASAPPGDHPVDRAAPRIELIRSVARLSRGCASGYCRQSSALGLVRSWRVRAGAGVQDRFRDHCWRLSRRSFWVAARAGGSATNCPAGRS
jgi:hypothetical protein